MSMSMRPRIEEVDDEDDMDIDNMDFDPSQFDPRNSIITPADIPSTVSSRKGPPPPTSSQFSPPQAPPRFDDHSDTKYINKEDMGSTFKAFQCLYPIYFDVTRSRAEGRRVNEQYAIKNPLARELIPVLNMNGFQTIFEPMKTHPKDWSNPGRVRVLIKRNGQPVHPKITSSNYFTLF